MGENLPQIGLETVALAPLLKIIESQQKTIESQQKTIESLQTTVHLLMSDRAVQAVVQPEDDMIVAEVTLDRNGVEEETIGGGRGNIHEEVIQEGGVQVGGIQEEGTETPDSAPSQEENSGNEIGKCV